MLVFSINIDLIERLPHDVFESVRDNMTLKKLDIIFERYQFLHHQANQFMKHEGKLKQQEIEATFKHIKGIYPAATLNFQTKMRSDALKKSQMNPKILMMKKNERIDRNNSILHNLTANAPGKESGNSPSNNGTYDMFRSTNPQIRKEAA